MIIRDKHYVIRSQNANQIYWEQDVYPEWACISALRSIPGQRRGAGVEPHYHDNDEIWLFLSGRGEVWLDGESFPITPDTVIYTPMGVVHRFQMFTDFDNVAIVTPLEGKKRPIHILVEEDGPPARLVSGFVIPGAQNRGPFTQANSRCPLSELRPLTLEPGQEVEEAILSANEYWIVLSGTVDLQVDDLRVELGTDDLALFKSGAVRRISAPDGARLVLAREKAK